MLSFQHALIFQMASFFETSHHNPLRISVVLHMCHGAQIMKILIMQFPQLLLISSHCCNNTELRYTLHTAYIQLYAQG